MLLLIPMSGQHPSLEHTRAYTTPEPVEICPPGPFSESAKDSFSQLQQRAPWVFLSLSLYPAPTACPVVRKAKQSLVSCSKP